MNTLYWLTDDLRLQDNPTLAAAAGDRTLDLVFCIDERMFLTDSFGNRRLGKHRWRLLRQSLLDLRENLVEYGQKLNVLSGNPRKVIEELLASRDFGRIIRSRQHALHESTDWRYLRAQYTDIVFSEYDSSTLYQQSSIDFGRTFPTTFSQFRRSLDAVAFRPHISAPKALPNPSTHRYDDQPIELADESPLITGGSAAGIEHLRLYFKTRAASTYKETRNALAGERFSTGFSPWLALGCVSPMQVFEELNAYEDVHGGNESTQWILFELMWREFFRWHAKHHGARLFEFTGIAEKRPLTSFYRERFLKWCTGNTPWPIVNACMTELRETGFLSNRGRQIVASCLVNELALDWRCGAGYFEETLIDHDLCSNWGNWQYIAGVGPDPRGGRHFNLEKQADNWDADGQYRERWSSGNDAGPLDSLDYYGWPQEPDSNGAS